MTGDVEPSDPADPSTSELARAARNASPQEFAKLYERVGPAVFAWASLRLRSRLSLQLVPEDLTQEVWCRALALFPSSDATHSNFRAWIFSVAKFVLLEHLRRQERDALQEGGPQASTKLRLLESVPDEVTSATQRIARDEVLLKFLAKVERFENEDRLLLIHCGLEGLTCAQAAERLGISRDAAIKRWQRLRERLKSEGAPAGLLEFAR